MQRAMARQAETLAEVGKGEGSTVVLPLPLDVIGSITRRTGDDRRGNETGVVGVG
jgi:hypothetical protein